MLGRRCTVVEATHKHRLCDEEEVILSEPLEVRQGCFICLAVQVTHFTSEPLISQFFRTVDNLAIVGRLLQELVDGDLVNFVRFDLPVDF